MALKNPDTTVMAYHIRKSDEAWIKKAADQLTKRFGIRVSKSLTLRLMVQYLDEHDVDLGSVLIVAAQEPAEDETVQA